MNNENNPRFSLSPRPGGSWKLTIDHGDVFDDIEIDSLDLALQCIRNQVYERVVVCADCGATGFKENMENHDNYCRGSKTKKTRLQ